MKGRKFADDEDVICTANGWLEDQDQKCFYHGIRAGPKKLEAALVPYFLPSPPRPPLSFPPLFFLSPLPLPLFIHPLPFFPFPFHCRQAAP